MKVGRGLLVASIFWWRSYKKYFKHNFTHFSIRIQDTDFTLNLCFRWNTHEINSYKFKGDLKEEVLNNSDNLAKAAVFTDDISSLVYH